MGRSVALCEFGQGLELCYTSDMRNFTPLVALVGLISGSAATHVGADVIAPGGKVIDCYCTDTQGARVELGQEICLYVGGRAFMALCDMSLNVPIWRDTGRGCMTSGLIEELLQPAIDAGGVDPKI